MILEQVESIIDYNLPLVSNLANVSAVLNQLDNLNWCGFYLVEADYLYLGPFQGEVACTIIPKGKGVCGEAFLMKQTRVVDNVLEYSNHIACSAKSRSEIVVPILKNDEVVALIDLDSPVFSRFGDAEQQLLEQVALILSKLF